jgi:hypothetical protein
MTKIVQRVTKLRLNTAYVRLALLLHTLEIQDSNFRSYPEVLMVFPSIFRQILKQCLEMSHSYIFPDSFNVIIQSSSQMMLNTYAIKKHH